MSGKSERNGIQTTIITDILREQLHSNGVVISDDMQMGAIAQYYGYEHVVLLARRGGRGHARNCESTPGGS